MISIKKQVKRFWKVFMDEQVNLEQALLENNEEEIKEITKILITYFEEFTNCSLDICEEEGIFEITFLPEQEKNVQLICSLLKEMAPEKVRRKWIIHSSLPALSYKALNTVLHINEKEYTSDDFLIYYEINKNMHSMDVEIYCDAFAHMKIEKANEIAVYMFRLLIGEVALEAYINDIAMIDTKKSSAYVTLTSFFEVLSDCIVKEGWSEYADATSIYRVFKIEEAKLESVVRKDMKMIFTTHPLLMGELLNNEYFTYHQFFDFGGEFGYLYYEHTNTINDAKIRQSLEKKLNELLFPLGIAKSIGGAIGVKYAYIDLAIFDKEDLMKVLPHICNKLSMTIKYHSFA